MNFIARFGKGRAFEQPKTKKSRRGVCRQVRASAANFVMVSEETCIEFRLTQFLTETCAGAAARRRWFFRQSPPRAVHRLTRT